MVLELNEQRPSDLWPQRLICLVFALAVLLWAFYPTYEDMVSIWWNASTFNHCFLIPLISLYLVWEKRKNVYSIQPSGSCTGLIFVFLSSLLWLAGELISVSVLQHLAVVSLIIGLVWSILGNRLASYLMFPLGYLYFSIPEGEFMVPYLMDWTAWFSVKLLRLTGIPVFLEARYITIPTGDFVVAEACSGINYLIASLSLCTVFAYLNYRSWNRRLFFMFLALVVPLLANGLRAYGIVMIAHLSDMKYATGVDHIIYGWFFFGIVIFILFYLGGLFREDEIDTVPGNDQGITTETGINKPVGIWAQVTLTLMLALSGQVMLYAMDSSREVPPQLELPIAQTGWVGPLNTEDRLAGRYVGVRQRVTGEYHGEQGAVFLHMAYYDRETKGQELITTVNRTYDEDSWQRIEEEQIFNQQLGTEIRQYVLRRGQREYLVWHWYDLHGQVTVSGLKAKLYQGLARARGSDLGAAAFSLYIELKGDRQDKVNKLQRFLATIKPSLLTMKPGMQ